MTDSYRLTVEPHKRGNPVNYDMDLGTIAKNIAGYAADGLLEQVADDEVNGTAIFEFKNWTMYVDGVTVEDLRNAWRAEQAPKVKEEGPVTVECDRCKGWNGMYVWGAIENGKPQFQGTCWKCGGTTRANANGKWAISG